MKRGILWHQLRKIGVKYHIFAYRRIENAARASRNGCMRTKMRESDARDAPSDDMLLMAAVKDNVRLRKKSKSPT